MFSLLDEVILGIVRAFLGDAVVLERQVREMSKEKEVLTEFLEQVDVGNYFIELLGSDVAAFVLSFDRNMGAVFEHASAIL